MELPGRLVFERVLPVNPPVLTDQRFDEVLGTLTVIDVQEKSEAALVVVEVFLKEPAEGAGTCFSTWPTTSRPAN